MSLQKLHINKTWTLFLDRDGVINRKLPGDYVKTPEAFEMLPEVPEAIRLLADVFGRLIVVSNQQGIGKKLMTAEDLEIVNAKMMKEVEDAGGKLDSVFYAPNLAREHNIMRKPKIGMGLVARKLFPDIKFKRSMMVGDSMSDMQFGKNLRMKTVLIGNSNEVARKFPRLVDYHFEDLIKMAREVNATVDH